MGDPEQHPEGNSQIRRILRKNRTRHSGEQGGHSEGSSSDSHPREGGLEFSERTDWLTLGYVWTGKTIDTLRRDEEGLKLQRVGLNHE